MASDDIRDDSITASSYYKGDYRPSRGRLYGTAGEGAWAARKNNIGEWLQVDLGGMKSITGTIIQGQDHGDSWVTSYKLHYSADGTSSTTYTDSDGLEKVFVGNTDTNTPVTNLLESPIDARYVRFVVQSWHRWIGMRAEIVGCERPKFTSLGCWRDKYSSRAIPILEWTHPRLTGIYRLRRNAIEKCYRVARSRGYTVFALQHGGQCLGGRNAHNTYKKYGSSTACAADGEGGDWANEVYQITGGTNRPPKHKSNAPRSWFGARRYTFWGR
ncbi:Retinoschisin [Branchiostoma belcheri]|nr:Retinoschisin [Branchiostoma belcheri]